MRKSKEWESQINGKTYNFSLKTLGKYVLTVNGTPIPLKRGFLSFILWFDEKFTFDGIDARLVIEKKPDIVVDGIYVRSGKRYVERPMWSLVLAVICFLVPTILSGFGALPTIFGFIGAMLCVYAARTSLPAGARVALCVGIMLLTWVICIFAVLYLISL